MSNEFSQKKIQLTPAHHLSMANLAAISLWIISTTYFCVSYTVLHPLQSKMKITRGALEKSTDENEKVVKQINDLNMKYQSLLQTQNHPITFLPTNEQNIIGNQIYFEWDYNNHHAGQRYVLEIVRLNNPKTFRFNVLNPGSKSMNIPADYIGYGEFLWRIIPGFQANNVEVTRGVYSDFSYFRFFPTLWDKIIATRKLIVGTNPHMTSQFNRLTPENEVVGFDIDLIQWLIDTINHDMQLDPPIELSIERLSWSELLPSLRQRRIDAIISNIPASTAIEDKYNVIFSEGYFLTQEVFISKKDLPGDFPSELKGKTVGAIKGTTSEHSARFLSQTYGFELKVYFTNLPGIYRALENNDINFAITDRVHVLTDIQQGRFYIYGPNLNNILETFYHKHLGRTHTNYAIAFHKERKNTLLKMLNQSLQGKQGTEMLGALKKKWLGKY